jgi:aminopeptidase N
MQILFELEGSKKNYIRTTVTRTYLMPIELFDSHSYQKGASVLHLLRYEVSEENFWEIMRRYVRKYKCSSVTTEDFRKTVKIRF